MKKVLVLVNLIIIFIISFSFISASCSDPEIKQFGKIINCKASCGDESVSVSLPGSSASSISLRGAIDHNFSEVITSNLDPLRISCNFSWGDGSEGNRTGTHWYYPDTDADGYINKERLNLKLGGDPEKNGSFWDVDDWPFDDGASDLSADIPFQCFKNGTSENCTIDSDNNGVMDYADCAACRYPALDKCLDPSRCLFAHEDCDDVDNDGFGHCQGNLSKVCYVANFNSSKDGDGKISNSATNFSCKGVKNQYGILDEFCQMVDDNVDTCSGSYSRCVKYMVFDKGFDSSLSQISADVKGTDFTRYAFVPGGALYSVINYSDSTKKKLLTLEGAACGVQDLWYIPSFKSELVLGEGPILFSSLGGYDSSFASNYKLKSGVVSCLALKENLGKKRNTNFGSVGGDQFIDSFRGELDFKKFWSEVKKAVDIKEKFSVNNTFKYSWEMTCVSKDKCGDGVYQYGITNSTMVLGPGYGYGKGRYIINYDPTNVGYGYGSGDNDGPVNLFETAPYSFFIHPISGEYTDTNGIKRTFGDSLTEFSFKLVDSDDPYCKFKDPESMGLDQSVYSSSDYLENPATKKPYCLDEDGDGFCGCPSIDSTSEDPLSTYCNFSKKDNAPYLASIFSTKFPDCSDNPSDDSNFYLINGQRFALTESLGWNKENEDKLFGAWNVHPLAPVTPYTCTLKFDSDCNKNFVDNFAGILAMSNPYSSYRDTPFDWNLSSGREIIKINVAANGEINKKVDLKCFSSENPTSQIWEKFGMETSFVSVGVLGEVILSSITPGSAYSLNLGGLYNAAVDLTKCVAFFSLPSDLTMWKNPNNFNQDCLSLSSDILFLFNGVDTKYSYDMRFSNIKVSTSDGLIEPSPRTIMDRSGGSLPTSPIVGGCFLDDTSIVLSDGTTKDIENIQIGDEVLAYDLKSSQAVSTNVTYVFVRNETEYEVIEYEYV